uniref:BTSP n=1 Tax=Argas monolakensis TaxID=34602 RepID=Q09JT5_ARGMO|nr:BTSP [Argas monolakensis]
MSATMKTVLVVFAIAQTFLCPKATGYTYKDPGPCGIKVYNKSVVYDVCTFTCTITANAGLNRTATWQQIGFIQNGARCSVSTNKKKAETSDKKKKQKEGECCNGTCMLMATRGNNNQTCKSD